VRFKESVSLKEVGRREKGEIDDQSAGKNDVGGRDGIERDIRLHLSPLSIVQI
jgi:hypothetical protein